MEAAASLDRGGSSMKGILCLVSLMVAQVPLAVEAVTCDGSNLAVTAVSVRSVSRTPYLHLYHVTATVTNVGNQAQAGNALQFVDVVQYGGRLDDRGIPPLAPGQSYTVDYTWPRSADAGSGTSPLDFRLRFVSPAQSCSPSNGRGGITV
jgi:hypothetical protein